MGFVFAWDDWNKEHVKKMTRTIMSNKSFLNMMPAQRDAEAKKWESGTSFEETRPLSERSRKLWHLGKLGRGRPPKPARAPCEF